MDQSARLQSLSVTPASLNSLASSDKHELLEARRLAQTKTNFRSFVISIAIEGPGAPVNPLAHCPPGQGGGVMIWGMANSAPSIKLLPALVAPCGIETGHCYTAPGRERPIRFWWLGPR